MRFTRYAHTPITRIRNGVQQGDLQHKPAGLWLTQDGEDDWYHWCAGEHYPCGAYRYQVTVRDERLLWLKTPEDIRAFTAVFNRDVSAKFHIDGRPDLDWYGHYIDWPRVAQEYNGIVIAPYQWECRMELMWYYIWDCNSACIWNAELIERWKLKRGGQAARVQRGARARRRMRRARQALASGKLLRKVMQARSQLQTQAQT